MFKGGTESGIDYEVGRRVQLSMVAIADAEPAGDRRSDGRDQRGRGGAGPSAPNGRAAQEPACAAQTVTHRQLDSPDPARI